QAVSAAEVPTAWPLTEVATERRQVANLWAGGIARRLCQRGILLLKCCIVGDLGQRSERANTQRVIHDARTAQLFDPLDIDQAVRCGDVVLHQRNQVGAAGENLNLSPLAAEQRCYLVFAGWAGKLKRSHGCLLDSGPRGRGRV